MNQEHWIAMRGISREAETTQKEISDSLGALALDGQYEQYAPLAKNIDLNSYRIDQIKSEFIMAINSPEYTTWLKEGENQKFKIHDYESIDLLLENKRRELNTSLKEVLINCLKLVDYFQDEVKDQVLRVPSDVTHKLYGETAEPNPTVESARELLSREGIKPQPKTLSDLEDTYERLKNWSKDTFNIKQYIKSALKNDENKKTESESTIDKAFQGVNTFFIDKLKFFSEESNRLMSVMEWSKSLAELSDEEAKVCVEKILTSKEFDILVELIFGLLAGGLIGMLFGYINPLALTVYSTAYTAGVPAIRWILERIASCFRDSNPSLKTIAPTIKDVRDTVSKMITTGGLLTSGWGVSVLDWGAQYTQQTSQAVISKTASTVGKGVAIAGVVLQILSLIYDRCTKKTKGGDVIISSETALI